MAPVIRDESEDTKPTRRLRHRELDRVEEKLAHFKDSVAKGHLERFGPVSMNTRVGEILGMVEGLAATTPEPASQRPVNWRLHKGNEVPSIDGMLKDIRYARDNVMPHRKSHEPGRRNLVIPESEKQIDFLRTLIDQWRVTDHSQQFPHLGEYITRAEQVVALYDFANGLYKDYERYFDRPDLLKIYRSHIAEELELAADHMKHQWPGVVDIHSAHRYLDESLHDRLFEGYANVTYELARLPGAVHPDYSGRELAARIHALQYEACSSAHRAFAEIEQAYRADRKAISGKQSFADPSDQPSPVLDMVYHVRWALLADGVHDVVKAYKPTLASQLGAVHPEFKFVDTQDERRETGQGKPFMLTS